MTFEEWFIKDLWMNVACGVAVAVAVVTGIFLHLDMPKK